MIRSDFILDVVGWRKGGGGALKLLEEGLVGDVSSRSGSHWIRRVDMSARKTSSFRIAALRLVWLL